MRRRNAIILTAAAALGICGHVAAQLPGGESAEGTERSDSTLWQRFEHASAQHRGMPMPAREYLGWELDRSDFIAPIHNDTSYVLLPSVPSHIDVMGRFRITPRWSVRVSNGNASNWEITWGITPAAWGVSPAGLLDARTLSFPIPQP